MKQEDKNGLDEMVSEYHRIDGVSLKVWFLMFMDKWSLIFSMYYYKYTLIKNKRKLGVMIKKIQSMINDLTWELFIGKNDSTEIVNDLVSEHTKKTLQLEKLIKILEKLTTIHAHAENAIANLNKSFKNYNK